MKYIYSFVLSAVLLGTVAFPASTFAATNTTDALTSRLQALIAEIRKLEADLARAKALESSNIWCYRDGKATTNCALSYPLSAGNLSRVEADIYDNFSRVHIQYINGRSKNLIFNADTENEVIDYLMDETGAMRGHILSVIRFNNNPTTDDSEEIDRITATITDDDTFVEVEFEDDDTERFTLRNETNKSEIIEKIADRMNEDEDDIEDVIRFRYDTKDDEEVDSIDVILDRDDDEATARVRYEDGSRDTFSYDTDDKDDIVSSLADDLDMRESEIRDIIEYEYR